MALNEGLRYVTLVSVAKTTIVFKSGYLKEGVAITFFRSTSKCVSTQVL